MFACCCKCWGHGGITICGKPCAYINIAALGWLSSLHLSLYILGCLAPTIMAIFGSVESKLTEAYSVPVKL